MGRKKIGCIICVLMICVIFITEVPKNADAQLTQEWVKMYKRPGDSTGFGKDIAVASSGNVIVTGNSFDTTHGYDFTTVAYDPWGKKLWVATYNGPGNGLDSAKFITIDTKDNVYITGISDSTSQDIVIIKYDPNGVKQWVARYDGPANGSDRPEGIALDLLGNVYVTGGCEVPNPGGGSPRSDFVTLKYDTNGNQIWAKRYGGLGSREYANDLVVDSLGNIYVTGDMDEDCATIKYDTNGNQIWVATYAGPGDSYDGAWAIDLDPLGNVYVAGHSGPNKYPIMAWMDYLTIKYDANGTQQWIARYDGPGNGEEHIEDIVVDEGGNVYITGASAQYFSPPSDRNGLDYATIAYDTFGNELWVALYNGPANRMDVAYDIELDSSGNIYVTGEIEGKPNNDDCLTIAYNKSGHEIWKARYNSNSKDGARAMAVSPLGEVFITGYSYKSGGQKIVTIKYSEAPQKPRLNLNIDPDTLNLKSRGKWITAYIDVIGGGTVNDINITATILEDTIPAVWGVIENGSLMVKFDRSEVEDLIGSPIEEIMLTISGEFKDGTPFLCSDTIRVIRPP